MTVSTTHQFVGVLFDSGDTLVRPQTGAWFPGAQFRDVVLAHGISDLNWNRLPEALERGMSILNQRRQVATEAEELQLFSEYYEILLQCMGIARPSRQVVDALSRAMVLGVGIEAFAEVPSTLAALKERGLRLGVASNAWPSLGRKYNSLGLRNYFDVFVVSEQIGHRKPDPEFYRIATEQFGVEPKRILFVDDFLENVMGARDAELYGILLLRNGAPPRDDVPWIADLAQVVEYVP